MNTDLAFAFRNLRRSPGFAATAILTLALGIAANNTVFTLVNGVLLRDLPFDAPDRIVELGVTYVGNAQRTGDGVSYLDYRDWQAAAQTFEGIGVYDEHTMNVSDEEHAAERFLGAFISSNSFALIGHRPVLGRDFREDDERDGAIPVVMLGHDVWRSRYGSNPDVVGRTIRVNGVPSVVIGVMPDGFGFPQRSDLWRPIVAIEPEGKTERQARSLTGFGRLRDGVTREQAMAELGGISSSLASRYPDTNRGTESRVENFRSGIGGPIAALFAAMMGAVACVLLIACANVANLLLARAAARAHEVSVRISLGASRWRIIRQLLVESLVLAALAGVLALAISVAAIRLFWSTASQTAPPYWLQFPMDWRVFVFLAVVCLGTSVIFGLVPALHTSKTNVVEVLVEGGRGTAGSRRGRRATGALVVAQLALTLVLLTGAGMMVRNLLALSSMEAGVDTASLVRLRLDLPAPAYDAPETRLAFYRRLEERLLAAPDLHAAIANAVPVRGGAPREILVDGQPELEPGKRPLATMVTIGRQYFETLGTRPMRGRAFEPGDGEPGRGAVIVNERFAAMHFGNEDALGRRIRISTPNDNSPGADAGWMTIVGVTQNVRQRPPQDGSYDPVMYVPLAADVVWGINILVRSASDVGLIASQVQDHVRAIDADLPIFDVRTIDDLVYYERWAQRIFGSMFGIFAAVALILATVGLYAVTAYSVAQRTREIGVRVALGAQARQVWWLVTGRASGLLAVGLLLGTAGSIALMRILPSMLTGAGTADPMTFIAVVALLVAASLGACLVPARRALAVDPAETLREG